MFKTIFGKLMAIFLVILIVAFSIVGVTLNLFLKSLFTNQKAIALEKSCIQINKMFGKYLENFTDPLAEVVLEYNLQAYAENAGSIVWVVTEDGHIYRSTERFPASYQKYKDESGYIKLPDPQMYSKVMSIPEGKPVKEVGDFFGLFKDPDYIYSEWLTIEKSFKDKDNTGKEYVIAIYMHTPVPGVQKVRDQVFVYFLISVGIAIIIAVVLLYIFSLRFTKPLKLIKNAARMIAGGEFSKRLAISSNDEIGELAKAFNQMAVALENLEEMRRGFIANVSHELRTPMTSIRGFIEGILDGTIPPEKQGYYLSVVRDETNRLNRLVNNLLDLARMEAGEVKITIRPFDINELIRICVIKLETLIVDKNIMVEAEFDEGAMFVNGDIDAIERVLYNLIHNAIKFTPENGKITLSVNATKDKVLVSVEDTGSGIENSDLDMIWERFYKSDKSRSKDKTGTGLGLAIVKNIINEHGQQIWVESQVGVGTTFTFTLERVEKQKELDES